MWTQRNIMEQSGPYEALNERHGLDEVLAQHLREMSDHELALLAADCQRHQIVLLQEHGREIDYDLPPPAVLAAECQRRIQTRKAVGKGFLFDVAGTLSGNAALSWDEALELLRTMKAEGHRIYIWSGGPIPQCLKELAEEVFQKPVNLTGLVHCIDVVFDDNEVLLRSTKRVAHKVGAEIEVVHASQMKDWMSRKAWRDDAST